VADSTQAQTSRSTEKAVANPVIPLPMATNVIGTLEPINTETGKWHSGRYTKKDFKSSLLLTSLPKMSRRRLICCLLGAEICDLIWDLFRPTDPTDATVTHDDMICKKLREHFVPATMEIAESFRFFNISKNQKKP
jgi:hypothetical protein